MIKSTYKIWIIFFILINLTLLFWSLEFFNYFENKNTKKENINIIKPKQEFKKSPPPKDESFPNEKSKVWSAFENNKNIENKDIKEVIKEDKFLENKIDNATEVKNNLLKKEKPKSGKDTSAQEEIVNNKASLKESENKSINVNATKKPEVKNNNSENLIFYVQIASLSKKDLVKKEWERLKSKYPKNMKNLVYISQEANLKGDRTFYRLLVGTFKSKNMAKNFCDKLNFKINCIIKKKDE